ncbi:hypothetical protein KKD70_04890 [Patescibacteria group bacterium]|nr:hypothetical protein [Patescibacteria group bacterium]
MYDKLFDVIKTTDLNEDAVKGVLESGKLKHLLEQYTRWDGQCSFTLHTINHITDKRSQEHYFCAFRERLSGKPEDIIAPYQEEGPLTIGLFHFDNGMRSEEVISHMEKRGFKPADLMALVACDNAYPSMKDNFILASIFSPLPADHSAHGYPFISSMRSGLFHDVNWPPQTRFLGVHK